MAGLKNGKNILLDLIIKILSQLILVFWYPSNIQFGIQVRNCAPKLSKIYINTDINC